MSTARVDNNGQVPMTAAAAVVTPLVVMMEIKGRGRALVASQPLRAGQIVLSDSPLLLYSARPLIRNQQEDNYIYCSNCFRVLPPSKPSVIACPSSCSALFCNPNCLSLALSSSHTPWICQALTRLRDSPSPLLHPQHQDRQVQARFLIAAYNLAVVSPSDFQTLLSLQGERPSPEEENVAQFLHSILFSLCPPPSTFGFSLELTAALLAKDNLNAFGLMEPFSIGRERSVRAYGIYPRASFFNHDCLPNACRFDYVDSAGEAEHNTSIIVRVIHDVPQGREICLSYFPVNFKYSDRQRRLREDYGFTCECDRCKVEANWSDDDDDEEEMDEDDNNNEDVERMDDSGTEDGGVIKEDNDFPHAYFFLRYMCNRDNCWGTLAPLPPSDTTPASTVMECNVCGELKNCEEEVMDGDALDE